MNTNRKNSLKTTLLYLFVGFVAFTLFGSYLRASDFSSHDEAIDDIVIPRIQYGDPIFSMQVTDANGKYADIKSVVRSGKLSAVAFMSASCPPCVRLAKQLKSNQHPNFDFVALHCAKPIPILSSFAKVSNINHRDPANSLFLVTESSTFEGVRGSTVLPEIYLFNPSGNLNHIFRKRSDLLIDDIDMVIKNYNLRYEYVPNQSNSKLLLPPILTIDNQEIDAQRFFSQSGWVVVTYAKAGCGSCTIRRNELAQYKIANKLVNLILYGSKKEYELERNSNEKLSFKSGYADLSKHLFFKKYPYSIAFWKGKPIFGDYQERSGDDDFWKRFKSVIDGRVTIKSH